MNEDDQFFIDRHTQAALVALLREVPSLADDLAITITKQDRIGKGGMRIRCGTDEQPLPINIGAVEAHDALRNELIGWIRHICETWGIAYTGPGSTHGLSHWLDRHVVHLAKSEGAHDALPTLTTAVRRARRAIDLPPEDPVRPDFEKLDELRDCAGTAAQLEKVLRTATEPPITRKRITYLDRCGDLPQHHLADGTRVFTIGDVLDAHHRRAGNVSHAG